MLWLCQHGALGQKVSPVEWNRVKSVRLKTFALCSCETLVFCLLFQLLCVPNKNMKVFLFYSTINHKTLFFIFLKSIQQTPFLKMRGCFTSRLKRSFRPANDCQMCRLVTGRARLPLMVTVGSGRISIVLSDSCMMGTCPVTSSEAEISLRPIFPLYFLCFCFCLLAPEPSKSACCS